MFEKFNIYDFYGYFVPGFCLVLLLLGSAIAGFVITTGHPPSFPGMDLEASIAAILFAYVAGHVIQTLSKSVSKDETKNSERFLLGDAPTGGHPHYTEEFRKRLVQKAVAELQFPDLDMVTDPEAKKRLANDYFWTLYELVARKSNRPDVYNGLYALYRGLYVLARVTTIMALLGLVCWESSLVQRGESFTGWQWSFGPLLMAWFLGSRRCHEPFKRGISNFATRFVDSIYRGFVGLHADLD